MVRHPLVFRRVQVREVIDLTPGMRRIVVGGPELEGFHSGAPDDHIKVFFRNPEGDYVTPVAGPADNSPEEITCALLRLWAGWDSTNLGARPAYYTTPAVARSLAWMRDPLGNAAYPGMTMNGGNLGGVPVRVSNYLADLATSGGHPLILVDEAEIYVADDGSVSLDTSTEASIEMSDTPAGSSSPTVAASGTMLVSMFQTNSLAIRAERPIWWGARRAGAVAYIDDFPAFCG